ncbi:hypothetical protein NIES2101_34725 [Calothrix sp. HK-06]|nr:hypothetical protein NIES2101_34725 [Calothrix sp. HK-06]
MLLQELINSQQQAYANIQQQIEYLQEQQRQIQAHLQQLGSVESQMLSAVQMMQEAISAINAHCPDELENYKQLVVGLFGAAPVAQLEAGIDESSDEDIQPEEESTNADLVNIIECVDVPEDEQTEEATPDYLELIKVAIKSMSFQQLKEVLVDYKLDHKGKKDTLKQRFIDYCGRRTEEEHESVWEYLKNLAPDVAQAA